MNVDITKADIDGAGHGNTNDPLARALVRTQGGHWHVEIYSRGRVMKEGMAWERPGSNHLYIDADTTQALKSFDDTKKMLPMTAILTLPSEEEG